MKRVLLILGACALVTSASTVLAEGVRGENLTKEQRRAIAEKQLRLAGGRIVRQGTFMGKVAIVNAQSRLAVSNCEAVAAMFARATHCNVAVAADGHGAQIVLTVIDDPKEPTMLLAPEDHWGKVNVAKLVDDLPGESAKAKFFTSRGRKMIAKALSILCGGGASTFPGNIMNAVTLKDLDLVEEQIPVDMSTKYQKYWKGLGITKREWVTYRQACQQGWAPAPTNDVQKAIWDKVHAMPTEPLKIKPETKKVRD